MTGYVLLALIFGALMAVVFAVVTTLVQSIDDQGGGPPS